MAAISPSRRPVAAPSVAPRGQRQRGYAIVLAGEDEWLRRAALLSPGGTRPRGAPSNRAVGRLQRRAGPVAIAALGPARR